MDTVDFAKAIADETRQKIMSICCCTEITVSEIVDKLDITQPSVSHHLKILRQAGLVTADRRGKEIYYSLNQERLAKGCCQVAENFAPEVQLNMVVDKN